MISAAAGLMFTILAAAAVILMIFPPTAFIIPGLFTFAAFVVFSAATFIVAHFFLRQDSEFKLISEYSGPHSTNLMKSF